MIETGLAHPEAAWHTTTHRLRFSDNDSVGHVNNAVYAIMFEAGRTELLDAAAILVRGGPVAPVIARLEIDFKREMSWPGDVEVQSAVTKLGTKSVHIRQRTRYRDEITAEGLSVLVLIDRASRRPVALTDEMRARFAPWTLPAA